MASSGEYPSTRLILARHGQARPNSGSDIGRETPLGEIGRRQTELLADVISEDGRIDAVYSSPLPRALETVSPLCDRLGLDALVDPRLTEFELGTGSPEQIMLRPDLLIWRPDDAGSDGETLSEFSARVGRFLDEAVDRHRGERVAVICHTGTIDAAIRWALAIPPANPWQHEFDLPNASITEIEFWPNGRVRGGAPRYASVLRVGDVAHLSGLVTEI